MQYPKPKKPIINPFEKSKQNYYRKYFSQTGIIVKPSGKVLNPLRNITSFVTKTTSQGENSITYGIDNSFNNYFPSVADTAKGNINPFLANVSILYPLKTPEDLCFSGVFRGYKRGA